LIGGANAQTFPARPVTMIVPFPAGGTNDVTFRSLARATERHLGQPIIIENKPGGSGTFALAQMAATAKPDGYTLAEILPIAFRMPFLRKTTYDPSKDFTFIIGVSRLTMGVVVRRGGRYNTFQEFVADAKARPDTISYGTAGTGSNPHIAMLQIARLQNVKWVHVPFKGEAEGMNALLGGHIDAVSGASGWAPQVNAGRLRLLVTFGTNRTQRWPDVPTLKESGVDWAVNAPYGLVGPKGMDPAVVQILHAAFKKGMEEQSFAATMTQLDQEIHYLGSRDYHDLAMKQIEEERLLVEALGLREE
jgi:tripartite-type tricarboxylate transporter receptor subunit TctC